MGQDTKTALLDIAENVARRRGFDAFSFADLADAVQIRKSSIHYHFPTKAALAEALVLRYHLRIEARLIAIMEKHAHRHKRLMAFVNLYRDATDNGDALCLCVSFSASQHTLPDTVSQFMLDYREMVLSWLESVFASTEPETDAHPFGPPAQEAPALLALVEGAQLAARTTGSLAPFDDATALFRGRLG